MRNDTAITVVSGLPRSGTSLLMQMLQSGGMTVVTDEVRTADVDNPRGYLELEKVKRIKDDASWLPDARGKAFKMVSQLLYELPATERYRIILMQRDLEEILDSQEKMLARLKKSGLPRDTMRRSYIQHLENLNAWLNRQSHMQVLHVSYNDLLVHPEREADRVDKFLQGGLDVKQMTLAVDSSLYRNRSGSDNLAGRGGEA